ncbi:uncharacterized protein LOC113551697 [Rhopalosiphum maidis]|uniref:uncharacterized protein LOC113551697 n=1 Tax=Rhopalosiphum maidis TaxID=43146 RepID=UPI000F0023FA|nr:uncharacterized protein LOC113551697 [Rhopalosiphum maidis]
MQVYLNRLISQSLKARTVKRSRHYIAPLSSLIECIKRRPNALVQHNTFFVQFYSLFSLYSTKTNQKPKMGAEKVTMNIVVVGQVQSAKAVKSVAKATPATSQLMNC